jgi:hypothetical protein
MVKNPIKVEFVGLLPVLYEFCSKCAIMDPLKVARLDYLSEQWAGYPPEVLQEQARLSELCQRLTQDFPVPVGFMSARGLWLSLKHRLGRGPAVVIDGKRVLSGELSYEAIKVAIEEERAKSER